MRQRLIMVNCYVLGGLLLRTMAFTRLSAPEKRYQIETEIPATGDVAVARCGTICADMACIQLSTRRGGERLMDRAV
jgi:hypothetical protein